MDNIFYRKLSRLAQDSATTARLTETVASVQRALAGALPAAKLGSVQSLLDGLTGLKRAGLRGGDMAPETPAGAAFLASSFSCAAGTRPYRLFVPGRRSARPGLLVMLHGCTQSAEDFAAGTRMNLRAEEKGWLVLYPAQVASANAQRCWNWFASADQARGAGEPALVAEMTRAVMAEYGVDPGAVFVAGLSAGGAAAAVLGAAYPDLFAAIGVHSGLACGAASDVGSAFMAMRGGRPGHGQVTVPAIVFHGDRDSTVNPRNADEVMAQIVGGVSTRREHGQAPGGLAYDRTVHLGADGKSTAELWMVHGAGHAWSGGSAAGSFTEPAGPDASAAMLRFFEAHRR
jgi:poly(hydroxyalkanoate) depolymerase family esterase